MTAYAKTLRTRNYGSIVYGCILGDAGFISSAVVARSLPRISHESTETWRKNPGSTPGHAGEGLCGQDVRELAALNNFTLPNIETRRPCIWVRWTLRDSFFCFGLQVQALADLEGYLDADGT